MTYKGFLKWANDRATDGRWGFDTAIVCSQMASLLYSVPWYKRKKLWQEIQGDEFVRQIVVPVNAHYLICYKYH